MDIKWEKFEKWRKENNINVEATCVHCVGEQPVMSMTFTGSDSDMTKIIEILLTYWEVREKRKEPKYDLRRFRKNIQD